MIMMLKYPSAVAFSDFLLKNGTEHLHRICTLCAFFTGYTPGPTVLGISSSEHSASSSAFKSICALKCSSLSAKYNSLVV
jgi:hypothetical protein